MQRLCLHNPVKTGELFKNALFGNPSPDQKDASCKIYPAFEELSIVAKQSALQLSVGYSGRWNSVYVAGNGGSICASPNAFFNANFTNNPFVCEIGQPNVAINTRAFIKPTFRRRLKSSPDFKGWL
jgi:hypothetical protein